MSVEQIKKDWAKANKSTSVEDQVRKDWEKSRGVTTDKVATPFVAPKPFVPAPQAQSPTPQRLRPTAPSDMGAQTTAPIGMTAQQRLAEEKKNYDKRMREIEAQMRASTDRDTPAGMAQYSRVDALQKEKAAMLKNPPNINTVRGKVLKEDALNRLTADPNDDNAWLQFISQSADPETLKMFQTNPQVKDAVKAQYMPEVNREKIYKNIQGALDTAGIKDQNIRTVLTAFANFWTGTEATANTIGGLMNKMNADTPKLGEHAESMGIRGPGTSEDLLAKGAEGFTQQGYTRERQVGTDATKQFLFDVAQAVPDMVVSIGLGALGAGGKAAAKMTAGQVLKGLLAKESREASLKALAKAMVLQPEMLPMGTKIFAQSFQQNVEEGMDDGKALFVAFINAYGQSLLEGGGAQEAIKQGNMGKLADILKASFGEGVEEIQQGYWEQAARALAGGVKMPLYSSDMNEDSFINPGRDIYSAAVGMGAGLGGGATAIPSMAKNFVDEKTQGKPVYPDAVALTEKYQKDLATYEEEKAIYDAKEPTPAANPKDYTYTKAELRQGASSLMDKLVEMETKRLEEKVLNAPDQEPTEEMKMKVWEAAQNELDALSPEVIMKQVSSKTADPEVMALVEKKALELNPQKIKPVTNPMAKLAALQKQEALVKPEAPDFGPQVDTSKMSPTILKMMEKDVASIDTQAVIDLAVQGKTAKQIAVELGVPARAVRSTFSLKGIPTAKSDVFGYWRATQLMGQQAADTKADEREELEKPLAERLITPEVAQTRIENVRVLREAGVQAAKDLSIGETQTVKLGKALGVDVIFYEGADKEGTTRGLYSAKEGKTIFINRGEVKESGTIAMNILGHEFLHNISENHKDLYKTLRDVIGDTMTTEKVQKQLDKYKLDKDYQERLSKDKELLIEEILADEAGTLFTDKAFWEAVAKKNETAAQKLIRLFRQLINRILKMDSENLDVMTELQIKDFRAKFEDAVADIMRGAEVKENTTGTEEAKKSVQKGKYPLADKGLWWGNGTYLAEGAELVNMTPDAFLDRAAPLTIDESSKENIDDLKAHVKGGGTLDPLVIYEDDKTNARASDGRHRAIAAKELGIKEVPVIDYTKAPKLSVVKGGNLVALHNITEEKLANAIRLGGFPVPSIAVTKETIPFTNFGEITLVGKSDLVDPSATKTNKIFNTDIYSKRIPQLLAKVNKKAVSAIEKELKKGYDLVDDYLHSVTEALENGNKSNAFRDIERRLGTKAAFLLERGETVNVPLTWSLNIVSPGAARTFLEENPTFSVQEYYKDEEGWATKFDKVILDTLGDKIDEAGKQEILASMKRTNGTFSLQSRDKIMEDIMKVKKNEMSVDMKTVREDIDMKLASLKDQVAYSDWVHELIEPAFGDEYFSVWGDGRERKIPFDINKLFNYMKGDIKASENSWSSSKMAKARGAKQYRSLSALRKDASLLVPEQEARDYYKQFETEDAKVLHALLPYSPYKYAADQYYEAMGEFLSGVKAERALANNEFNNVPEELVAEFVAVSQMLIDSPVSYFEAKPQRIVRLDEFAAAVVSETVGYSTINSLEREGLKILKYESYNDESWLKAVEDTRDMGTRFSVRKEGTLPTSEVNFQNEGVEASTRDSQGRIDIFKEIIKTGKDYHGFTVEDIMAPIGVKLRDGKYYAHDGNHRLLAYKQLGIENVPVVDYNTGEKLSTRKESIEKAFKDSKVRNRDRSLKVVYHGTQMGDFYEFSADPGGRAQALYERRLKEGVFMPTPPREARFFFSDNEKVARTYSGVPGNEGARVKEFYLNITNPKVVDYKGQSFHVVGNGQRMDRIIEKARADGYDGVIIKNVYDSRSYGDEKELGTNYIAFKANQIKSPEGELEVDLENNDVRFSLKKDNFDKWFGESKVVDEAGVPLVVWHGGTVENEFDTDRGAGATQFGPGAYFAGQGIAEQWVEIRGEGKIHSYFLRIEKPYLPTAYPLPKSPERSKLEELLSQRGFTPSQIEQAVGEKEHKDWRGGYYTPFESITDTLAQGKRENGPSFFAKTNDTANTLLREAGYDGIIAPLYDVKQYVIFSPNQAKSATDNVGDFDMWKDDVRFSVRKGPAPEKTVTAYKLMRTDPRQPGKLFPLFVDANTEVPQGVWLDAEEGEMAKDEKTGKVQVKSKLGLLAYRPGWHLGDMPLATHIGVKGPSGNIEFMNPNHVWVEAEVAADVDYQPEATQNGVSPKTGKVNLAKADIKKLPVDGMYRFKTNPNMTGAWIITGSMKINRVLSDEEAADLVRKAGYEPLPRAEEKFSKKKTEITHTPSVETVMDKKKPPVAFKTRIAEANEWFERLYTKIFARERPISRTDYDTGVLASNTSVVSGTVDYVLTKALVDKDGKTVGKSWKEVTAPFMDNKAFWDYMIQKHNIDRFREGKPVDPNMTSEDSATFVEEAEKQNPEFKVWSEDVAKWIKTFMKTWGVDTGMLDVDVFNEWNDMYPFYFPTYRDFEDDDSSFGPGKRFVNLPSVSKAATGSDKDVTNPVGNVMLMVNKIVRTARYNQVGQSMANFAEKNPDNPYVRLIHPNQGMFLRKKPENLVMVWDEGIPLFMEITNKELLDAMNNLPRIINNHMGFRKFNNLFKGLITHYNPLFAIRNATRDVVTAYVYGSQHNPLLFTGNLFRAYYDYGRNTERAQKYKALGGGAGGLLSADEATEYAKMLRPSAASFLKVPLKAIEWLNQLTEQAPRLSEFNYVLEKTGDVQKALHASQEVTVNFARGGVEVKQMEPFVPYLNASVQGIDRFFRAFVPVSNPKGLKGKERLMESFRIALPRMAKAGFAVSGLQIASYIMSMLDDEEKYRSLDQRTKDSSYVFPLKDGTYLKIPKARELGVLFGTLLERALIKNFEGYGQAVLTNFTPVNPLTNNIFSPVVFNLYANKDFAGRTIVPQSLQGMSPENQWDSNTSEIAKEIGKRTGWSPKQIDYVVDAYTGIIGDILLPATTKRAGAGNAIKRVVVNPFIADPTFSSQSLTSFYDKLDELALAKNDKNKNVDSKIVTPEEKAYSAMNKISSQITKSTKYINANLKSDDKKVEAIKDTINRHINKALAAKSTAEVLKVKYQLEVELYKLGVR